MFAGMFGKFNALKLPGCAFWYKVGKRDSITLDGSNNVSSINDLSGHGRNLSQGTAGNRPIYTAAGIGGRPSIEQQVGTARYLTNASITGLAGITKASIAVVVRFDAIVNGRLALNTSGYAMGLSTLSTNQLAIYADAVNHVYCSFTSNDPIIAVGVYNGELAEADRMKIWINGTAQEVTISGTIPTSLPEITAITLLSTGSTADMAISEAGMHTIAYTDTQRQLLQNSLGHEYGITVV